MNSYADHINSYKGTYTAIYEVYTSVYDNIHFIYRSYTTRFTRAIRLERAASPAGRSCGGVARRGPQVSSARTALIG